jgi:hypothetical protein
LKRWSQQKWPEALYTTQGNCLALAYFHVVTTTP